MVALKNVRTNWIIMALCMSLAALTNHSHGEVVYRKLSAVKVLPAAESCEALPNPNSVPDELSLGLADEGRRPGTKKGVARSRADRAVDAIRKRFGGHAVDYGSASRLVRSVPDEFRRLAEREL